MNTIKDQDIKKYAEQKIELLRKELRKWYALIEALDESQVKQTNLFESDNLKTEINKTRPNIRIKENPTSLRERCEKILYEADEPMTTRELKKLVEQKYNQEYNFYSFSGSFSQSYRRRSSFIKKYDIQNPTQEIIAVYGLKNWFNPITGELEKEYLDKVFAKYGTK